MTAEILRPKFGGRPSNKPITTQHDGDTPVCRHEYVAIHRNARRVVCRLKKCGIELDPFDVLLSLAHEWDNVTWAEYQRNQLAREIEDLKRQRRNLKAQIRRATK